jgi:hypothetical protein
VGVAEQLGVGDPAQPSVEPMMGYPGLADAGKTASLIWQQASLMSRFNSLLRSN